MAPVSLRTFKDFSTLRVIVEKVTDRRLGHESENPPDGWKWDTRYIIEDKITETLPFPGLKQSHLMSIPREYWQNGPISGRTGNEIKVEEIKEVFAGGKTRWVPVIHNGDINIWRNSTFFFSDDSVIELVSSDNTDAEDRNTHILAKTLRFASPIVATIFRRDRENEFLPWRSYTYRYTFTGTLDSSGSEQETREGDTIYSSNIDTTKREFISFVREGFVNLLFNQNIIESVTSSSTPSVINDFNDLEYVGTSDGTDSQIFETSRFPVSNDSYLAVYVVDISALSWTTYTVVSEFTAANQVILDEDLGILTFGTAAGVSPPPGVNKAIYIAYRATARIEYEEDGYGDVSLAVDADVNPLSQSINKGFVTIARTGLDVASIELSTTKDSYPQEGAYGPVYVGADYASLLATVYSSSGEIVPNIEVTFYFETSSSFGGIGGSSTSIQRRTGFDGVARTYYVPPVSVDEMGFYVTSVSGNSLSLPSEAGYTTEIEIYTYYVLKDDPTIGIAGANEDIGEVLWDEATLNGRKVIAYEWSDLATNPISGHFGSYIPIRPSSITSGNILTYSSTLASPDSSSYGSVEESGTITSSALEWITDTSQSWVTNELRGQVVYSSSLDEKRRIASNTSDTIYLVNDWSSIPSGSFSVYAKTVNLGAYWVVSNRTLDIRASAYSPKLGRTIYSNLLSLKIEIPEYMRGSYISSSLQEIPFGWRLVDDIYEQASAVNGATYISINPIAGPYPIVDVISGETWDPYSGIDTGEEPYPFWPYWGYPGEGASSPFGYFSLSWEVE